MAAAPPYITRTLPPYDLLHEEGLAHIETPRRQILAEFGIEIRGDAESLDYFGKPAPISKANGYDLNRAW